MEVKFMWNGIKVDGKLYRAHYSMGHYTKESGLLQSTITIYGRDYIDLPQINGLTIINESDLMTDYFENDRIRVLPDNIHYEAVKKAYEKQEEHNQKRFAKKYGKTA